MSTNVGNLTVGLGYDLSALDKGSGDAVRKINNDTQSLSAEMKRTSREGAEAWRLVDESLGIHISRPLTRLITQEFPGFASAMQSLLGVGAFSVLAIAGVEFFDKISKKIEEARAAQEKFAEASKKVDETIGDVLGGIDKKILEITGKDRTLHFRLEGAAEAKAGIEQIAKAIDEETKAGEKANSWLTKLEAGVGDFFSHTAEGFTYIAGAVAALNNSSGLKFDSLHDAIYGSQGLQNMKTTFADMRDAFDEALKTDKLKGTHEALLLAQKDIQVTTAYLEDMKKAGDKAGIALAQAELKRYQSSSEVEKGVASLEAAQISAERQQAAATAMADLYRSIGESMKKLQPETDPLKKLGDEIRLMKQQAEHDFADLGRSSDDALQLRAAQAALVSYERNLDRIFAKAKADADLAKAAAELPTKFGPGSSLPQLLPTISNVAPVLGAGGTTAAQFDVFKSDAVAQTKLLAQAYADVVTPAQKFELVQQELDLILKNADGSFKGGAEGAAAYTAALQKAREEMAKATDQMERLLKSGGASGGLQAFFLQLKGEGGKGSDAQFTFDLLNKGLQGFEDETVKALTGAKTSWRSFFESLDQMALKFVLNKLFSSLLNSNFASGIGSWFSGLAGAAGGAGGSAAAAAPSALSDIGINSFATGTDFAPGGLSLVGEEGPELVNLPTGAAVTPNSALRGMPGVTVHIDARGGEIGVEDKIARALSASMPHMVARAVVEASELQKRSLR